MKKLSALLFALVCALPAAATDMGDDGDTLTCGSIEIDNKRHSVTVQGETCELTFKEFELLKYLMINQGIVLSRDKLRQVGSKHISICFIES